MKHIWQARVWPNFDYDRAETEPHLAAAIGALGEVSGLQAGLDPVDLEELRLAQVVQEAMSSFGIEGVTLDAAEIEASVIASGVERTWGYAATASLPLMRRPSTTATLA